ncbi:chemotaxis protein CheB [Mesorhizobium sp. WSM3224]|uniref:chemotaxis protein CheB n=1 Tax=Mesorhizobium sp. WSM3224 TaxID=1040986 RepID=UPI0003F8D87E|nr:chemotaxis protein CheB [Mesorhizobium sp. WSM3224]
MVVAMVDSPIWRSFAKWPSKGASEASNNQNVIVIGASTGGIEPLKRIVGNLPVDFPAALFIVLHNGQFSYLPDSRPRGRSTR